MSDGAVVLQFRRAYVYSSDGTRGVHSGEGSTQDSDLVVLRSDPPAVIPEEGIWVSDGSIEIAGSRLDNMVPIPFTTGEPCTIDLTLTNGERLVVRGLGLEVVLRGESKFVASFEP